jgi:hypothetical protein
MVPKWTSKYIAHRDDIGSLRSDQQGDRGIVLETLIPVLTSRGETCEAEKKKDFEISLSGW